MLIFLLGGLIINILIKRATYTKILIRRATYTNILIRRLKSCQMCTTVVFVSVSCVHRYSNDRVMIGTVLLKRTS